MPKLHRALLLSCLALCWSSVALGQGSNSTFTSSTCTAYGVNGALTALSKLAVGPDTILIGDRGSCTLQPPAPGCGTGTIADPYHADCGNPMGVATSTAGTPFEVVAGSTNIDTIIITLTPVPISPVQPSPPVPLGPWLPLGSGLGILLLALLRLRRVERVGK